VNRGCARDVFMPVTPWMILPMDLAGQACRRLASVVESLP